VGHEIREARVSGVVAFDCLLQMMGRCHLRRFYLDPVALQTDELVQGVDDVRIQSVVLAALLELDRPGM
jgi:hypothetical protein